MASTGPMIDPCGTPFILSTSVPSALCIGAFNHLSMYSSIHLLWQWRLTAIINRSCGMLCRVDEQIALLRPPQNPPCRFPATGSSECMASFSIIIHLDAVFWETATRTSSSLPGNSTVTCFVGSSFLWHVANICLPFCISNLICCHSVPVHSNCKSLVALMINGVVDPRHRSADVALAILWLDPETSYSFSFWGA